jgi:ABC-2 type transport system permease protein
MSRAAKPGFLAVAGRELRWIWQDRAAFLLVFIIPLLAASILAATFSEPVIRRMRVAIVDQDRTQTSMAYVQGVDAAPGVAVAERFDDLSSAMHAVRSGEVIAVVFIPEHLERDALAGRRPQIVVFYNEQLFTAGNLVSSSLRSALGAVTAKLPTSGSGGGGFRPGQLVVERYALVNPQTNYAQFLLRAILPTVLHVLIAIAGGFAVGSEFHYRNMFEWLTAAGGSPATALAGKLAPYLALFFVQFSVGVAILHLAFHLQFRGDPIMAAISALLLVAAYLALGALFQLLMKDLASGLSLTGIICSPAFGFAGIGFPVLGMSGFAKAWGSALPLRWYLQILFDQAARGSPISDSATPFAWLAGLAILFSLLALLRLKAVLRAPLDEKPEPGSPPIRSSGVAATFLVESQRILRSRGAFGLIVLAPLIYGVLYPQPYLGQLVRQIPIAVVDGDGTELSDEIVQTLNADQSLAVVERPATLVDAQRSLAARRVFGILEIPPHAERDLLKGDDVHLPAYVDSTYLILYSRVLGGITEAVGDVELRVLAGSARADGSLAFHALASAQAVSVLSQPLFNPTGGYASYVVPAAFLLILQQTLLMAVTTLGAESPWRTAVARGARHAIPVALGRSLAHLAFSAPGFVLYLFVLPRFYGFSAMAPPLTLALLAAPYMLAISFLGQCLGALIIRREAAVLLLIGISLPLFFLVGIAWPRDVIPHLLARAADFIPSSAGIDGLLRANQMGASLADLHSQLSTLWLLVAVYGVAATLLMVRDASRRSA